MKQHISAFLPDIIHYEGTGFFLVRLLRKFKIPEVVTIHGFTLEEARYKKKLKEKVNYYVNGILDVFLRPDNVIHLSSYSKEKLSRILRIRNETIIPNAVIEEFFNIPPKKYTSNKLLYIGVIDENKNLLFLLKALNFLKSIGFFFELDVLGDFRNADYKNQVFSFVEKYSLDKYVLFNGWLDQYAVMKKMEAADILVVSSRQESLPMVIAEAMASGKAVVAPIVGGVPEMISNGKNGILYHCDHLDELVDVLKRLYNNGPAIHAISSLARYWAYHNYLKSEVASRTLAFYNALRRKEIKALPELVF